MNKIKVILFIMPLLIGVVGYMHNDLYSFDNALYLSLKLYMFDGEVPITNIYIQIARWTAPIMMISGVIVVINQLKTKAKITFLNKKKLIVVYGDDKLYKSLNKHYGKYVIKGDESSFIKAGKYVLGHNEDETNINIYTNNINNFQEKNVYLKNENTKLINSIFSDVKVFSYEEAIARLYWKEASILGEVLKKFERDENFNIAIINLTSLGEQILLRGLQNNIFHSEQKIIYHVFGEHKKFQSLYHQLKNISKDQIIYYDDEWYLHLDTLKKVDRIILTEAQEVNLNILGDLYYMHNFFSVHAIGLNDEIINKFSLYKGFEVFNFMDRVTTGDYIFKEKLLEDAKRLNLQYIQNSEGVNRTFDIEKEWRKLSPFTKGSNISSVDYHLVRLELCNWYNKNINDEKWHEVLSELEHIRWCRYHIINNWKQGNPQNGLKKNEQCRIHQDLVDYEHLKEIDKQKDRDNISFLMNEYGMEHIEKKNT